MSYIATPLCNNYRSQPQYANIKCIVLCYGIPSRDTCREYDYSLTRPHAARQSGRLWYRHWGLETSNPYAGQNVDFATFRDSAGNVVHSYLYPYADGWKLNYLVCRLDGFSEPTQSVTVDGSTIAIPRDVKAMVDRSLAATGSAGTFVLDGGPDEWPGLRSQLEAAGQTVVGRDSASGPAIVGQPRPGLPDVMGFVRRPGGFPDTLGVTTWAVPSTRGGPAGWRLYNTNDGQSFRFAWRFWGAVSYYGDPEAGNSR